MFTDDACYRDLLLYSSVYQLRNTLHLTYAILSARQRQMIEPSHVILSMPDEY